MRAWSSCACGASRPTLASALACTASTTRSTCCENTYRVTRARRSCRRSRRCDWLATTSPPWRQSLSRGSSRTTSTSRRRCRRGFLKIRWIWSPEVCSWIRVRYFRRGSWRRSSSSRDTHRRVWNATRGRVTRTCTPCTTTHRRRHSQRRRRCSSMAASIPTCTAASCAWTVTSRYMRHRRRICSTRDRSHTRTTLPATTSRLPSRKARWRQRNSASCRRLLHMRTWLPETTQASSTACMRCGSAAPAASNFRTICRWTIQE